MPTPVLFSGLPPFPSDVRTASIPRLSLARLLAGDPGEHALLFEACRTFGFLHLDLRDAPEGKALLQDAEEVLLLNQALHDLPLHEKMRYPYEPPEQLFGYKHVGRNKVESGQPDRYEAFTFAQDDLLGLISPFPNPSIVTSHRPLLRSFTLKCRAVAAHLFASLSASLSLPSSTLSSLHDPALQSGTTIRLLRYPPHPPSDRRTALLGHTDIGSITLLFAVLGGLQVSLPPSLSTPWASTAEGPSDDAWHYVRPEQGHVLVNMGDAMTEWSGGLLRSDLHRVTWAPGAQAQEMRFSVAFLMRPEYTARMESLVDGGGEKKEEGDGEETVWTALKWERRKSRAIIEGRDVAKSKGGMVEEREFQAKI